MASVVRSTALRAGGACVRCRKGKTKCVYENGRSPCKNCAKGMHECYLPSESMSHGGHGVSPARVHQRARESLPSERVVSSTSIDRQAPPQSSLSRHVATTTEKYVFAFLLTLDPFLPIPTFHFPCYMLRTIQFVARARASFLLTSAFSGSSGRSVSSEPFPSAPGLPPPAEWPFFSLGSGEPESPFLPHSALSSQIGTRNFFLHRM